MLAVLDQRPRTHDEARRFLDARVLAGDAHVLELGDKKRVEVATK